MIKICNDRSVFPNNIKISNQYENNTRSIDFDLSDVQFTGNTYLICKYQGQSTFYAPLLLDSNFSIPVETFLSAQAGAYTCVIVISTVTIDENYDFSSDNPLFVSNEFTLNVEQNFLTGTATAWQLTPAAQNYFDQLIALVEKVQEDLDSGAFNGNGIQSITKIGSEGLVDTYQILFTDGSTFDFQVTNGATPTITIQDCVWFVNGVSTDVSAIGQKGDKGDPGVGIVSIEKTSASGNVDTYTITFTNQTTSTFTVTNGTDGVTPNIQIGTVTTLEPGQQATATITGTPENPLLNLGISQGQKGEGASDNIIYKDVAKQLNPNITDSFQKAMWNLKLYGQSTQITTVGNNLFDISKVVTNESVINNGDGTLTINGYYVQAGSPKTLKDYAPLLESGKTYCFNAVFKLNTMPTDRKIYLLESQTRWNLGKSILMTDECLNSTVVWYSSGDHDTVDTISEIMINEGEEPLPYEPYTGGKPSPSPEYPQEITAISEFSGQVNNGSEQSQPFTCTPTNPMYSTQDGRISDYVDVEKGVEVYNLKPITFNGSEKWKTHNNPSSDTCISFSFLYNEKWVSTKIMCNAFEIQTSVSDSEGIACFNATVCQFVITIQKSRLSTLDVDGFKQWLNENNVNVVIRLATPTETPIDPEQLAILKALYTYTGVTNFLCNAPVSFTYERSLQIVINNLENAINQTNANILLGGTL